MTVATSSDLASPSIHERDAESQTVTLPQVLNSRLHHGHFGKWHLGDEDAYQPDRRGLWKYSSTALAASPDLRRQLRRRAKQHLF
jgi:hypothetical protein